MCRRFIGSYHQAESIGELNGVKICWNALIITHLLFSVQCFLFFRADETRPQNMKHILSLFEAATGKAISLPNLKCIKVVMWGKLSKILSQLFWMFRRF